MTGRSSEGGTGAEGSESEAENLDVLAEGRRKNGAPYRKDNTREDGSYRVGKNRTPEHTRFAVGDGRRRGKRPKGSRNFDKDWENELTRRVRITRDGKEVRVSAHHAQVMTAMALASKGRERSQELVFRKAVEVAEHKRTAQSRGDDELIAEWLAQQAGGPDEPQIVGDDAPETENSQESEASDDHQ